MGKKELIMKEGESKVIHIENDSKSIAKHDKFINTKLNSQ